MADLGSPVTAPPITRRTPELRGVDLATFRTEIVPAYRPVVLRGAVAGWPAVAVGAGGAQAMSDYLLSFDRGGKVQAFIAPPEVNGRYFYRDDMRGVNFERVDTSFRDGMARILDSISREGAHSVYIGSSPTPDIAPGFAEANRMPLVDPRVEARLWVGGKSVVAPHYDLSDNIACVVMGRRRFTLFPPEQVKNLYVSPLEFTLAGQPCSMVELNAPDFERYPRFREALEHAEFAELEPGDAIYIPYLWWHNVESLSPFNVLVNYWWNDAQSGQPEAFEALIHGILSVRHNPPARREAWRAMFDHYVFAKDDDPAEHLPPIARGILSPMSPKLAQFIRNFLLQALGRRQS